VQDLAICRHQLNPFRICKSDELAVVGCAVGSCHQLQNRIRRNGNSQRSNPTPAAIRLWPLFIAAGLGEQLKDTQKRKLDPAFHAAVK
jgi:hypothetical protein